MDTEWPPSAAWRCSAWGEQVGPWLGRLFESDHIPHTISCRLQDVDQPITVDVDDKTEEETYTAILGMVQTSLAGVPLKARGTTAVSLILRATMATEEGQEIAHLEGPCSLRMVAPPVKAPPTASGSMGGGSLGGGSLEGGSLESESGYDDDVGGGDWEVGEDEDEGEDTDTGEENSMGGDPLDDDDYESLWAEELNQEDPEPLTKFRDPPAMPPPYSGGIPNSPPPRAATKPTTEYTAEQLSAMTPQQLQQVIAQAQAGSMGQQARPMQQAQSGSMSPGYPPGTPGYPVPGMPQTQALYPQPIYPQPALPDPAVSQSLGVLKTLVTHLLGERRATQQQQILDSRAREATYKTTIGQLTDAINKANARRESDGLRAESHIRDSHRREMDALREGSSSAVTAHQESVVRAMEELESARKALAAAEKKTASAQTAAQEAERKREEISRTDNPMGAQVVGLLEKSLNVAAIKLGQKSGADQLDLPPGPYTLMPPGDYRLPPGLWPVVCGQLTADSEVIGYEWAAIAQMGLAAQVNAYQQQIADEINRTTAPPQKPMQVKPFQPSKEESAEFINPNNLPSSDLAAGLSFLDKDKQREVLKILGRHTPEVLEALVKEGKKQLESQEGA